MHILCICISYTYSVYIFCFMNLIYKIKSDGLFGISEQYQYRVWNYRVEYVV